ncbi:MAG: glycosyltransferase family 4 protein [Lachnospiraceae bacterium]|nr:glycosyltransferase family 4 protein [Lachnospiraceae bacterium]
MEHIERGKIVMHVVYVTVEFVTEKISGGLGTYVDNMARIMRNHGHRVTIITLSHENGEFHYINKIHVIRVREDRQQNILARTLSNSWRLMTALERVSRMDKVDIVQTASLHAIGLFRSRKVPYIVRISSDNAVLRHAEKYIFDLDKALQEKTLFDRMELYAVRHADYAFAPSKCCAKIVAARARCRVDVVESPFLDRTGDFDESVYQEKLAGKKYLLFNSTLSTLKGTHIGIEATDQLMSRYPDLYMVYAGIDAGIVSANGTYIQARGILNRLSKKYGGRVLYLGSLKREQLFPVIANAFACVLLSRTENLSNSCIEAMSMKKIVIATYGASFEQLIRNKDNGLLVKRDSPKALLKAVAYLMDMTQEGKRRMEERASISIERLNSDQIYEKMIDVYNNTIQNFRRKIL